MSEPKMNAQASTNAEAGPQPQVMAEDREWLESIAHEARKSAAPYLYDEEARRHWRSCAGDPDRLAREYLDEAERAERILAALSSSPAAPQREPDAWRISSGHTDGPRWLTDIPTEAARAPHFGMTVTPLYAGAPPEPVVQPSVVCTPGVVGGEPTISRTRVPVRILAARAAAGMTEDEVLDGYPRVSREALRDALAVWPAIVRLGAAFPTTDGRPTYEELADFVAALPDLRHWAAECLNSGRRQSYRDLTALAERWSALLARIPQTSNER